MKPIPYGRQHITNEDIEIVTNVLRSDFLTQGPEISNFENAFARYVGSNYAVAISNGTAALHLCALALNVEPGDKIITSPITFVASANCIRYCGGDVVFADINPQTYLLDLDAVRKLLEEAPKGTYKGVIPVDLAGRAVDLEKLRKLADEFDLWIVEDACHAPGGYFRSTLGAKERCGNGRFADMSIFSFHPVKHIACGEGGMITTNDQTLYEKLLKLRTHGITRNAEQYSNDQWVASGISQVDTSEVNDYPGWYMEMQNLGFNYRLTDVQAALGNSQLSRADEGLKQRREIAKKYADAFSDINDVLGQSGFLDGHAYHLYIIEVEDRLGLYNFLRGNGIYAQVHYIPAHLMPYYQQFGWKSGDLPNAEKYYSRCLSLPMFPTLTSDEQEYVIGKVLEYLKK